ncbi:MAG: hypothetical protein JWM11_6666 [Planctomycetaceae bacterium]|nr:hypothetical protein [Planctomycetaceae bacterium]
MGRPLFGEVYQEDGPNSGIQKYKSSPIWIPAASRLLDVELFEFSSRIVGKPLERHCLLNIERKVLQSWRMGEISGVVHFVG